MGLLLFIMAFTTKSEKYMFNKFPMRKGIFITLYIVILFVLYYGIMMYTENGLQNSAQMSQATAFVAQSISSYM